MVSETLQQAIDHALAANPQKRVIPFTAGCKKYFIKCRKGNGRNRFAKENPSEAFWCEAYKIMTVCQHYPLAPHIVFMAENYFVMEGAGSPMQAVAKEAPWQEVKYHAFEKAGHGLALLHEAGLHHGRPALRDVAYDMEQDKITLLDWENEKVFISLDVKALDLFLFVHSCFRENWAKKGDTSLIDAFMKGYLSVPGSQAQLEALQTYLKRHDSLFHLTHALSRFHWTDVVAVDKTHEYFLS